MSEAPALVGETDTLEIWQHSHIPGKPSDERVCYSLEFKPAPYLLLFPAQFADLATIIIDAYAPEKKEGD